MATPTYPSKRYFAAGAKKGATWGTAVALGANAELLITGDSGITRNQKFEPYPAIDQIMPKDGILGVSEAAEITPPVSLQYEAGPVGTLLACLFGAANSANGGEANVYLHTFTWANSVTNFVTYAEERPGHVWEVPSAMPYKAVIKPEGAQIAVAVTMRGNTLKDDSAINTANEMDALTPVSRTTFLHMSHGQFLMCPQANATITANNDTVEISDFEINLERSIDNVHVVGGINIAEPKEGDIPNCTLKITLPRASNTNVDYFSAFEDMTPQKARLTFTGALAGNNAHYSASISFPRLMLVNAPDIKMDGVLKNELTFAVLEANAAANGMNDTRPYMEIVNKQTANYLA